ncbi:divinyl chlorophyllide a 8-vinyl-reductase, chloroplastic-like [Mizuhopecten yessoensis]|uniref:Flavin reductase (NADPH) n=1 Tax=Mizuhopecten yessoensis TaxID=6573 RepID=A0A210PRZ3_MIZYE|nr:divinyl chlorophyllide a 8-vinyl-reductase, chloroplastic-like [Mizuhopecten yessoensis]OWF39248.1 Flavin reductase (NADPH) [Mizuhopecten yessoensis]
MKLLVVGSTGGSGLDVIKEALSRNHEVVALARSPNKVTIQHANLKVVKGNVFEPHDLEGPIAECDAVISCLGCNAGFLGRTPTTFYSDSMTSLTTAMRAVNKTRIVCMSSWCTKPAERTLWVAEWIMRPLVIGNLLKNLSEMENDLEQKCSDLDWTVVRAPGLYNADSSGKEIKTEEYQFVTGSPIWIPRRDVAIFILNCIEKNEWTKKIIAIGL